MRVGVWSLRLCFHCQVLGATSAVSVDVSLEKRIGYSVEKQVKMSCEGSRRKKYLQG